jgi:predicted metal-dependent peptidase
MNPPNRFYQVAIKWQIQSPFLAEFLLKFNYKEDESVRTIGISVMSRRIYIIYKQQWIDSITDDELEGVLFHEILHLIHDIKNRVGDRDPMTFNLAQDICINEIIINSYLDTNDNMPNKKRFALPKDGAKLKDIEKLGYKNKLISEEIYNFLFQNKQKFHIVFLGDKTPEDMDSVYILDKHSDTPLKDIDRSAIDNLINEAKVRSFGYLKGKAENFIKELIKTRDINWQKKLSMLMSKYINEPGNIYENTWSKRNRRNLPLPGTRKKSKNIILSVDTSGSISDEEIAMFFDQIEKIIKDYSRLLLIEWDTEVRNIHRYKKNDWKKITIRGRGGTDIHGLYDYIKCNLKGTSILINFTDGCFDWKFEHYNIPTIWVINNERYKPSFGKHIIIEKK